MCARYQAILLEIDKDKKFADCLQFAIYIYGDGSSGGSGAIDPSINVDLWLLFLFGCSRTIFFARTHTPSNTRTYRHFNFHFMLLFACRIYCKNILSVTCRNISCYVYLRKYALLPNRKIMEPGHVQNDSNWFYRYVRSVS